MPNFRNRQQGTTIIIATNIRHVISPPVDIYSMELNSKEDHQTSNTNATGERRAKHIGILLPPPFVATLHVVVEKVSNDESWPSIGEVVRGP